MQGREGEQASCQVRVAKVSSAAAVAFIAGWSLRSSHTAGRLRAPPLKEGWRWRVSGPALRPTSSHTSRYLMPITPCSVGASFSNAHLERSKWGLQLCGSVSTNRPHGCCNPPGGPGLAYTLMPAELLS